MRTTRRNTKRTRRWLAQNKKGQTVIRAGRGCRVNWRVRVLANFEKATLLTVVKWIAKQTCQNFILSSQVRGGQLHIISRQKVSLRAAYRAFFTALQANNFTAYRVGTFWKIINARISRQSPIRTIINRARALPYRDEMVTYLHRLKHLSANQVVGTIRYLSSSSGGVIPYQTGGILIITDYATNIRRILKVLKSLDIPQAETRDHIYVLQIQHAQAQNIAAKLQQLFQVGQRRRTTRTIRRYRRTRKRRRRIVRRRTTTKKTEEDPDASRITKMIADERTNQLVLLCNPQALKRVSRLLKDLDIPLPGDGQIRVHYLKFANAEELSQTLSQMTRGTRTQQTTRRYRRRRTTAKRKKASELFEGEVKITADKPTNSLVIVASRRDYDSLLHVIRKLDIARKQVFIELVILEVSMKKSNELGLTFHSAQNVTGDTSNPTLGILGTALGGINSLVLDPTALMGLAFGLRGAEVPNTSGLLGNAAATGGISLGVPSFGVLIRAIQTDSDTDLVSAPHILATANKEATIQVGQNVPFIAGTTFTGAGVAGVPPIRNIQRQDVALTLKIKPQVDAGSYVRLDFEQELTELGKQDPELGPTTTKQKIKTVILAKDRQTVVIGGLISKKTTTSVAKVPFLGDIPLLGALFRVNKKEKERRNLLVFLTPYIIHSSADFRRIYEQKMKERKQFMKLYYSGKDKDKIPSSYNYDRSVGLFETIHRSIQRGKKQAKELKKTKVKSPPKKKPKGNKKNDVFSQQSSRANHKRVAKNR